MYKRISAVLFPIVALLLIGTAYWGYREHQVKNAVMLKAEGQYQRAFHDLSYHVDKLHSELGHTLAVSSVSQGLHRKSLVNVWRLTSEAQNEINQLPLTLLPFNKTEDFLTHIANFSYKTAVRDLTKEPLSPDEFKTLKTLYANSKQISQDLQKVQGASLNQRLKWLSVEEAMSSTKEPRDNTIVDGFKTVDNKVAAYPEINWGPAVSSVYSKRSVTMLSGNVVSAAEVKNKAITFFSNQKIENVKVVEHGGKTQYATYTATGTLNGSQAPVHIDYTKRGGHLIRFLNTRDIGKKVITKAQALKSARHFLAYHRYPEMEPVSYDEYDNLGSFVFVRKADGVLIYPERFIIRIALDNGEVTGIEASDFEYKKHKLMKTSVKPQLSAEAARKKLNPSLKEKYHRLAMIENELGEPILCYEFVGSVNGANYRIYVNANNGAEESIEELRTNSAKMS